MGRAVKRAAVTLALGVVAAVGTALWGVWFLVGCAVVGSVLVGLAGGD